MTPETDRESAALFDAICRDALLGEHLKKGIGTLGERTLHVILKRFYETDPDHTEKKVGRYVADILRGSDIVEIQTRSFGRLREKLPVFLAEHRVKVVFPIAKVKYVCWLDPETGELSKRRKSPKTGGICDFLLELYALRPILPELSRISPNGLSFDLAYLEIEEYRLLTGRSRDRKRFGAVRCERIPTSLFEIATLESPSDFSAAIPQGLPESFTSAEFAKAWRLTGSAANRILSTLVTLGTLELAGKRGRAHLYKRKDFSNEAL